MAYGDAAKPGLMDAMTYRISSLLSFYTLVFLATGAIFYKASELVRAGRDVEGFSRGTFVFFITMNIIFAVTAAIFNIILVERTFRSNPIRRNGVMIFRILLIFFLALTIANAVYLGKINRYITEEPKERIIGRFRERVRVQQLPVSQSVVGLFWIINIFATTSIIFQVAFGVVRNFYNKRKQEVELASREVNPCI